MVIRGVLGPVDGNVILGVALAIGWLAVLGFGLYQYNQRTRSRERSYRIASVGMFWLAFSVFRVATTFTDVVENPLVVLTVGLFCVGVATGAKRWQLRSGSTDASVQA